MIRVRRVRWLLIVLVVLVGAAPRPARADATEAAIDAMLDAARARGCRAPADGLDHILCRRAMQVGVRNNYPGFGVLQDDQYLGTMWMWRARLRTGWVCGWTPWR